MTLKTTVSYNSVKLAKIRSLILAGLTILSIAGLLLIFRHQDKLQNPLFAFALMNLILIGIGIFFMSMKYQQDISVDNNKVKLVVRFGPFRSNQYILNKNELKLEITQDEFQYYIANFVLSDGNRIRIDRTPTKDRILEITNSINEVLR